MSVYRRGKVWHYDFTHGGDRYRGSTKLESKPKALEWLRKFREPIILGEAAPREVVTLRRAADEWFAACIADKKSAITTALRLKIMFRHIDGELPVPEIGAREIAAAIKSRKHVPVGKTDKAPANGTINRDLIDTTLRPILNYARDVMEEPIKPIPWKKLRLSEPSGRERTFTAAEIDAWRAKLPEWHRPLFDFYRTYGARLREAFFHPDAYDAETGRVIIKKKLRKNTREHVIPLMAPDARAMAARASRAKKAGLATVWFRDEGGTLTPIHWRGFQSASKQALIAAEIEDARPAHDLRHHAITALVRGSGNLAAGKRLAGHESIQSTMRYAHADDEDVLSALRHTHATKRKTETQKSSKIKSVRRANSGT